MVLMPLTVQQRRHLETRLQEERERALRLLNRSAEDIGEASQSERAGDLAVLPAHPADRGTDTMQTEFEAANATRVSHELEEIDAALERLQKHPERFGICEDTGRDIPFERLDIIPWARTCNDQ